jgi:hypothetical protein
LCCLLFGVFVCFVCFWVFGVCFLSCTVTAQWIMYRSNSVLFCLTLSLWPMLPLHKFGEIAQCNCLSGLINDLARAIWRWTEKKCEVLTSKRHVRLRT